MAYKGRPQEDLAMKTWFLALALGLASTTVQAKALLDHNFRKLAVKETVNLQKAYGGQVVLVVNTASKCGFTKQYEGLEAMHAKYKDRGFAVLGFPSNDFMGQEPGTEKEIQEFCTLTYGVKFPMFQKVSVKGKQASPLYQQLAKASGEAPQWNFHKYLIGRDGKLIAAFGSRTAPDDAALVSAIEKALAVASVKR
jgi:glutathione peroxidase